MAVWGNVAIQRVSHLGIFLCLPRVLEEIDFIYVVELNIVVFGSSKLRDVQVLIKLALLLICEAACVVFEAELFLGPACAE